MQQLYLARLAVPTYEPSQVGGEISAIIIGFFAIVLALTLAGAILYLYVSGACQATRLRPFRFAVYILLLIFAMTLGIGLIQQTRP
jgi:predicted membrane channel-forming protein YqfA (hemolysin III family)